LEVGLIIGASGEAVVVVAEAVEDVGVV